MHSDSAEDAFGIPADTDIQRRLAEVVQDAAGRHEAAAAELEVVVRDAVREL